MRSLLSRRSLFLMLLLLQPLVLRAAEVKISVAPDHETGIYAVGETATWTVQVTSDDQPAAGEIQWYLKSGGLTEIDKGTAPLTNGQCTVSGKRDDAGTLLLVARYPTEPGKFKDGQGGAVYNPFDIPVSAPEPDDFDAFWAAKLAELAAVPVNVKLEPAPSDKPDVEYYTITMDNIRGTHIYGQLAKPKGKTNLPGLLQVQWAGVYPLQQGWVTGPASQGWLALNIIAHDIPALEPKEFYDNLNATTLKGYPTIGRDDRETSYFLRMYLSCYRAAEYLATHPDWNGQTLMVQGGSQGGGQSVVTAGLHPKITAFAADVPAMCDQTGQLVGRAQGWPRLTGWGIEPDSEKALEVAKYFDAVNFAKRCHAKACVVGTGLVDTTCPAAGVLAMYNQLPCEKQIAIMPQRGHGGDHGQYYQLYGAFSDQQRRGRDNP